MTSLKTKILVWDTPTRVFHWLLVLCFAGAYLSAESERWQALHLTLGYTLGGLVAFRVVWGLMGTRHARFASFVRGPAAVIRYCKAMLRGQPEQHVGHNPAGALAIVFLLLMSAITVFSGWAVFSQRAGKAFGELHEGAANLMLAVVLLHVAAVALTSWLHRENLVRAMVTGRKQGVANQGIRRPWRVLGLVLLLAVLGFWWQQWQSFSQNTAQGLVSSELSKHGARSHNDDD